MNRLSFCLILSLVSFLIVINVIQAKKSESKKFGEGFTYLEMNEINNIPNVKDFLLNYMFKRQPLIIRGGAKASPAFYKWSDDYFLAKDASGYRDINSETVKKESRQQDIKIMPFHEFVRVYNDSELYMVDSVPDFLRSDINIPCPLRCEGITFNEALMWYSSGGTKSVVHTDSVDNLNCLYRGRKQLIMVNPKHSDNVDLDHPEGAYSAIDVDDVDYDKYPGLLEIEYYNISMNAGDCLYIPYLWIHQVRSFGHNIAVNLWWNHYEAMKIDADACAATINCEDTFTLSKVIISDSDMDDEKMMSPELLKDRVLSYIGVSKHSTVEDFQSFLVDVNEIHDPIVKSSVTTILIEFFHELDADGDGLLTKDEVHLYDEWQKHLPKMIEIQTLLEKAENYNDADDISTKTEL